ncbi:MAG: NUDIX domain-containing protein [Planctomycetales bacterium]|nr:NUDIX domain-containing protein [Planctomycetales bacterium]NIM10035.1 NUDIX domain-containing protein [Planctomycetales bacterium]NIN09476.1 NUDIX domain-containing protein [Planctomycetales bacterium]NIN78584.1 NUDIX domain-containing protein [Planctomycetales bacterium]NIO35778.1 NUDIX domain-containing protein [Planctomycetales bacterium]
MAEQRELLLETRKFRVVRIVRPWPDGQVRHREIVEHPGAVTIVPLVDADHVCLIRNFRVTVGQSLLELPAGTLEPGEDPATTAGRELAEETGYRAAHLQKLCRFFVSPGVLNEIMHLFVASQLTPGTAALAEGEHIEPQVVPWSEAVRMAVDGTIQDAKTILGLLYYDRIRNQDTCPGGGVAAP